MLLPPIHQRLRQNLARTNRPELGRCQALGNDQAGRWTKPQPVTRGAVASDREIFDHCTRLVRHGWGIGRAAADRNGAFAEMSDNNNAEFRQHSHDYQVELFVQLHCDDEHYF
jgi:hypothetical protein